jgi:hypothetical protein
MKSDTWATGLWSAASGVAIWRVIALLLSYLNADAMADSLVVKALLAGVGLVFVVCGLLVAWKRPTEATRLFAWFCICSGLHWGGPLDLESGQLRTALILFYVLVSSLLGATLLLQFALCFPKKSRLAVKKSFVRFLYAPLVLATVLAAVYLVSPAESTLHTSAESLFMLLHVIVSNLFSVAALALLVSFIFRVGLTGVQKRYVGLMVGGMLTAWVPYLVASAVGVETDPWNLTVVALPVSFAIAILGVASTEGQKKTGSRSSPLS